MAINYGDEMWLMRMIKSNTAAGRNAREAYEGIHFSEEIKAH